MRRDGICRRACGVILWTLVAAGPAQAGSLPVTADRCAIAYALSGQVIAGCRPPARPAGPARAAPSEGAYTVHFDFDSGALKAPMQAHLRRLGALLTGPLEGLCVKLIGHTDTVGPAGYNLGLSRKRANSVRRFLLGPGGIAAGRVLFEGRGERAPLAGLSGTDPRNRRVEILARPTADGRCA